MQRLVPSPQKNAQKKASLRAAGLPGGKTNCHHAFVLIFSSICQLTFYHNDTQKVIYYSIIKQHCFLVSFFFSLSLSRGDVVLLSSLSPFPAAATQNQ
jgi:hypothetical protein